MNLITSSTDNILHLEEQPKSNSLASKWHQKFTEEHERKIGFTTSTAINNV